MVKRSKFLYVLPLALLVVLILPKLIMAMPNPQGEDIVAMRINARYVEASHQIHVDVFYHYGDPGMQLVGFRGHLSFPHGLRGLRWVTNNRNAANNWNPDAPALENPTLSGAPNAPFFNVVVNQASASGGREGLVCTVVFALDEATFPQTTFDFSLMRTEVIECNEVGDTFPYHDEARWLVSSVIVGDAATCPAGNKCTPCEPACLTCNKLCGVFTCIICYPPLIPTVATIVSQAGATVNIGANATTAQVRFNITGENLSALTPDMFTADINNQIGFDPAQTTITLNAPANTIATVNLFGGTANTSSTANPFTTLTFSWGTVETSVAIVQASALDAGSIGVTQAHLVPLGTPVELFFNTSAAIGATAFRIQVPAFFTVSDIGIPAGWAAIVEATEAPATIPASGPGNGTALVPGGTVTGPATILVELHSNNDGVNHPGGNLFTFTATSGTGAEVGASGPRNSIFHPFTVTIIDRFGFDSTVSWVDNLPVALPLTVTGLVIDAGLTTGVPGYDIAHGGVEVIDTMRVLMGDVNRDGRLSSADAAVMARAVANTAWAANPDPTSVMSTTGHPFWSRQHANIGCDATWDNDTSAPTGAAVTSLAQWLVGIGGWMCTDNLCINVFYTTVAADQRADDVSGFAAGSAGFITSGCQGGTGNPDISAPAPTPGFIYIV